MGICTIVPFALTSLARQATIDTRRNIIVLIQTCRPDLGEKALKL